MNVFFFFTIFKRNLKQELKPNFVITLLLFEFLSQQRLCFFCLNFLVLQSKTRKFKQHLKIVVSSISYYPVYSQKAHRLTKEKSNFRFAALCALRHKLAFKILLRKEFHKPKGAYKKALTV